MSNVRKCVAHLKLGLFGAERRGRGSKEKKRKGEAGEERTHFTSFTGRNARAQMLPLYAAFLWGFGIYSVRANPFSRTMELEPRSIKFAAWL